MPEALVRQFMSDQVLTVPHETSLKEVATCMSKARVSCAVVCGDNGVPVGVVTERDLVRAYARDAGSSEQMLASSAMSQGVLTLTSDSRCVDAMTLMKERAIRRIVITDANGVLAGIITQTDLLRAHAQEIEIQRQRLEQRVAARTRELEELNTHLANLSRIDPLLGIANRRAMDDRLDSLEQKAKRYDRPYAVALVDVDHFKRFNDRYGHGAGDETLKQVARTIARDIRAADAVYRYGGEEFLIVFPEVAEDGAAIAAEHVRLAIEALDIPHDESPFGHISVSMGVAGGSKDNPCWNTMVARADQALYEAKGRGRNCVERASRTHAAAA